MTKIEQAKAVALGKCRLGCFSSERSFVKGLNWLVEHSADTDLTFRQKWFLDSLLWRYRKQLAGREEGFELPTEMPREEAYQPGPRKAPAQASLI